MSCAVVEDVGVRGLRLERNGKNLGVANLGASEKGRGASVIF